MGWLSIFEGLFTCHCCTSESDTAAAFANERACVPTRVDRLADVSRAFHERKGIEAQAQSEKDAAKRADRERRSTQRHQRRMAKAEARSRRRGNERGPKPSRIEPVLQGDAAAQGSVKC